MSPTDKFIPIAEAFATWASSSTDTGPTAARTALVRITTLYLAALHLPIRSPDDGDPTDPLRVTDAEWKAIYANAAHLPLDYYGELFDPLPVPPGEPGVGSLSDDIADIYRDVVTGLRLHHAGHPNAALWQWTFSLQSHWGEHATGAMRALHSWLAANDALFDGL